VLVHNKIDDLLEKNGVVCRQCNGPMVNVDYVSDFQIHSLCTRSKHDEQSNVLPSSRHDYTVYTPVDYKLK